MSEYQVGDKVRLTIPSRETLAGSGDVTVIGVIRSVDEAALAPSYPYSITVLTVDPPDAVHDYNVAWPSGDDLITAARASELQSLRLRVNGLEVAADG